MSNPSYSEVLELHQKVYQMKSRAEQAEKQLAHYKESYKELCYENSRLEQNRSNAEKQLAEVHQRAHSILGQEFGTVVIASDTITMLRCAVQEGRERRAELAAKDAANHQAELILRDQATSIHALNLEIEAKDARIKELLEDLCRLDPSYKL